MDGAFKIIRYNPKATVGSAVIVASVSMAIPVLVTLVLTATLNLSLDANDTSPVGDADIAGLLGGLGSLVVGAILQSLGLILVTAIVAEVVQAAAIGRRLSLEEAWAATAGKRWRVIGLSLLLGLCSTLLMGAYVLSWVPWVQHGDPAVLVLWGAVTLPAFTALMIWFWVRVYYLPMPALLVENIGIVAAIKRGFALTRQSFWRTFGIALLAGVIAGLAGQVLSIPVAVVGQVVQFLVSPQYVLLTLILTQAISQVIVTAFVAPFSSVVTCIQYVDLRIRKEAYDVELLARAGVTGQ